MHRIYGFNHKNFLNNKTQTGLSVFALQHVVEDAHPNTPFVCQTNSGRRSRFQGMVCDLPEAYWLFVRFQLPVAALRAG
jgi:hypothetical protein